mmetsp:Transcript_631/g.1038  ORF Transcript_631/g.1038 Transcript_631/m.1038 type:complete len:129 (+) Transcript_631:550-936(+)
MVSIDSSSTVRCLILLESTQFCTMTNATLQSFITEGLFRRKSSQNYSMLCSTYRRNKPIARNARWLVMKLTLVTKNYSNSGSLSAVMVKRISYWRKKWSTTVQQLEDESARNFVGELCTELSRGHVPD